MLRKIWPKGLAEKPSNKQPVLACNNGPESDLVVLQAAHQ
jgi:hypothetical protein